MNTLFHYWKTKSREPNQSGKCSVPEMPTFLDIFNRESEEVKQRAITAFFNEINGNPAITSNANILSYIRLLFRLTIFFGGFDPGGIYSQITSANSLAVKCETKNGINFFVETFFDEETGYQIETVVNVFKGHDQLFNDSGVLDEMLAAISVNFESQMWDYVSYLNNPSEYELPSRDFTTAEF